MEWPGESDRLIIVGRTGSGKTQAACWHLSHWDFREFPWVIINTKDDDLLNSIAQFPLVKELNLNEIPGENGLYVIRPMPDEGEELDNFLQNIWEKRNCGIYIDEGYMIEEDRALNRVLTQGRSRKIPMIILSQRPVWITKFMFSEASFFQIYDLNMEDDRKTVSKYVRGLDVDYRLPDYHSLWYNVNSAELTPLAPVPDRAEILASFKAQLTPKKRAEIKPETPIERIRRFI